MDIIRIENVVKVYNQGKLNEVSALRGVDFVAEKGESIAIMGVSGSGKSTLLHIIGCLDSYTSGKYYLKDKEISTVRQSEVASMRNGEIGFVLQDYGLLLNENVYNNVKIPLLIGKKYRFKQLKQRVMDVLAQLGIAELARKKVRELSGGQKQRVAIARAIINEPSIVLADEPTGALDSTTAEEIINVLLDLNKQGITVIVVTHDKAVAAKMSRTVTICDGKV